MLLVAVWQPLGSQAGEHPISRDQNWGRGRDCAHSIQKFLGQGPNLRHGSNPGQSSENTGSLTHRATYCFYHTASQPVFKGARMTGSGKGRERVAWPGLNIFFYLQA